MLEKGGIFVFITSGFNKGIYPVIMSSLLARFARVMTAVFVFAVLLSINASAQRRFYIAPDDHTDYYWAADGTTYRQAFLTMTDYYLDKMDATAGNPSDTQMRWN